MSKLRKLLNALVSRANDARLASMLDELQDGDQAMAAAECCEDLTERVLHLNQRLLELEGNYGGLNDQHRALVEREKDLRTRYLATDIVVQDVSAQLGAIAATLADVVTRLEALEAAAP